MQLEMKMDKIKSNDERIQEIILKQELDQPLDNDEKKLLSENGLNYVGQFN